ncbi:MAG: hypothetical protein U0354_14155 [Candidatus Sericytochromatia bacterium]
MIQIITGKEFEHISDLLIEKSNEVNLNYIKPTPLNSSFWHSTLTPSSTEVFIRNIFLDERKKDIYTIQPCIRFIDLGNIGDSTHSLFFNMWTCFFENVLDRLEDSMEKVFLVLENITNMNRDNWYFIYHDSYSNKSNQDIELLEKFNINILNKLNINSENIIPTIGSISYLYSSTLNNVYSKGENSNKIKEEINGPRIEIFIRKNNGDFLEIATLVLFQGFVNIEDNKNIIIPPSLAVAVGIERITLINKGNSNLYEIGNYNVLSSKIINHLNNKYLTDILESDINRLSSLVIAYKAIESLAPEILDKSNYGPNKEKRKIKSEILRLQSYLGIENLDLSF